MADNRKYIQAQSFSLAIGVSTTETSITLQSFNFPDGSAIASADLGTVNYGTIEPNTSREEQVSFTGMTTNADGTVTLSGVTRGLGFGAGDTYSEQTDLKTQHGAGATFILSNNPAFYNDFVNKYNDESMNGMLSVQTPTSATHAATKQYVDDNVNGGAVSNDRIVQAATAGESVAAGDLLYFDDTDNEWKKTVGTTASTLDNVLLGIAQGSGSDGATITGGVLTYGLDGTKTGLTVGVKLYAGDTAGAIVETAGTVERVIGWSKSATEIYFDANVEYTPTAPQKEALNASESPSSTNPFVTRNRSKTAGETINGATLPVPVYQNKTDNEFYACDANDSDKYKYLGFATSNSTDGNSINVQFNGVVSGFTGLSEGEKYYVQDTVGTIGTTPGTQEILVGVAISETELLIQKGNFIASGSFTFSSTATEVITLGFRPSLITLNATISTGAGNAPILSVGKWDSFSGNNCHYVGNSGTSPVITSGTSSSGWDLRDSSTAQRHSGSVITVTDTGFTLSNTKTGTPSNITVTWIAQGKI